MVFSYASVVKFGAEGLAETKHATAALIERGFNLVWEREKGWSARWADQGAKEEVLENFRTLSGPLPRQGLPGSSISLWRMLRPSPRNADEKPWLRRGL